MLSIHFFTFNPFQENTYIISNEKKQCWIVDPGMYDNAETKILFDYLAKQGFQPQSIINTHTHIDHILGVNALIDQFHISFGMHEKDLIVLKSAVASATIFGLEFRNTPKPDTFIGEGALQLGEDTVEVRLAPGHSPGSIVFYYAPGNWMIGGDVLFEGSIGRTDLPGGDHETLINSIKTQLFTLPDDTVVYPGHGGPTTIGDEKRHNPFLQGL